MELIPQIIKAIEEMESYGVTPERVVLPLATIEDTPKATIRWVTNYMQYPKTIRGIPVCFMAMPDYLNFMVESRGGDDSAIQTTPISDGSDQ